MDVAKRFWGSFRASFGLWLKSRDVLGDLNGDGVAGVANRIVLIHVNQAGLEVD